MLRVGLPVAFLLTVLAPPLLGQRATFVGVVEDSVTGRPLHGATVTLLEWNRQATTDERGWFALDSVPGGQLFVLIRMPGYREGVVDLELTVTRPVAVDLGFISLSRLVTELDPVVVEGDRTSKKLENSGFYERMAAAEGTFITQEQIEKQNPTVTSEILRRVPGFRVHTDGSVASGRGIRSTSRPWAMCEVNYYIDGVHAEAPDIDVVIPSSIAGIEVYSGSATTPPAFRIAGNPRCGVVVVWTRVGQGRPR